jgi:PKD repeat protein
LDKRIAAAAILISAVMLLMTAAPATSAGIHEITKYEKGPKASSVTWVFVPPSDGIWNGHIVNNGLRWVVIDVNDNTSGVPSEVLHERINLNVLGIMPTGTVDTKNAIMSNEHTYEITVTPNGPRLTSCTVEDLFRTVSAPVASFTVTVDNLMVSVDGSASSDTDGTVDAYDWTFGDGGTATGKLATHTYLNDGTYIITLTVTDNDGLWGSASEVVIVSHQLIGPTASFTATMEGMTVSVDASLSSDPDGVIQSYAWDFGDGSFGTGVKTTHDYTAEGTYTVVLTVTDADLLTDSASEQVTAVKPPEPPVASFTALPTYLVVAVDASASYDPDGAIVSYAWDFGDGGTGVDKIMSHTYLAGGTYTITLTVVDSQSLSASASSSVTVQPEPDSPPTAEFTFVVSGLTVDVDASLSTDDHPGLTYSWDWGDGTALGSGVTASHTYTAPSALSASNSVHLVRALAPVQPYYINGYTYAPGAVLQGGCSVTVTNMRTLQSMTTTSGTSGTALGYYSVDLSNAVAFPSGYAAGDPIQVTAVKDTLSGQSSGVVGTGLFTQIDVNLVGTGPQPFDMLITLTVTDSVGQTSTVSHWVTLTP